MEFITKFRKEFKNEDPLRITLMIVSVIMFIALIIGAKECMMQ